MSNWLETLDDIAQGSAAGANDVSVISASAESLINSVRNVTGTLKNKNTGVAGPSGSGLSLSGSGNLVPLVIIGAIAYMLFKPKKRKR
jgi:hypothetical protein